MQTNIFIDDKQARSLTFTGAEWAVIAASLSLAHRLNAELASAPSLIVDFMLSDDATRTVVGFHAGVDPTTGEHVDDICTRDLAQRIAEGCRND